jgi:hypothetical protein
MTRESAPYVIALLAICAALAILNLAHAIGWIN